MGWEFYSVNYNDLEAGYRGLVRENDKLFEYGAQNRMVPNPEGGTKLLHGRLYRRRILIRGGKPVKYGKKFEWLPHPFNYGFRAIGVAKSPDGTYVMVGEAMEKYFGQHYGVKSYISKDGINFEFLADVPGPPFEGSCALVYDGKHFLYATTGYVFYLENGSWLVRATDWWPIKEDRPVFYSMAKLGDNLHVTAVKEWNSLPEEPVPLRHVVSSDGGLTWRVLYDNVPFPRAQINKGICMTTDKKGTRIYGTSEIAGGIYEDKP